MLSFFLSYLLHSKARSQLSFSFSSIGQMLYIFLGHWKNKRTCSNSHFIRKKIAKCERLSVRHKTQFSWTDRRKLSRVELASLASWSELCLLLFLSLPLSLFSCTCMQRERRRFLRQFTVKTSRQKYSCREKKRRFLFFLTETKCGNKWQKTVLGRQNSIWFLNSRKWKFQRGKVICKSKYEEKTMFLLPQTFCNNVGNPDYCNNAFHHI